jgi:hypothetical protein
MRMQCIMSGIAGLVGAAALLTSAANAGTLVGTGTFENPGDLTIVNTGGEILEFLDLMSTVGMSVDDALDEYDVDDFRWATGDEVSELYEAFDITYAFEEKELVDLGLAPTSPEATTFLSFINTSPNSALGWIDDYTTGDYYTYSCVSVDGGCFPVAAFTISTESFWPTEPTIGVYLVRTSALIPEPSTGLLLGGGLLGLAMHGRRRSAQAG